MKRILLAYAALPLLAGCAAVGALGTVGQVATALGNVPAPVTVADSTVLDERGAIAVEQSYRGFRTVLEALVDAGLIRGERATQARALDNRAFAAVQAARAAYRSGNAASYGAAVAEARAAISAALGAVR